MGGKSRSASVIIAYLMQKRKHKYHHTFRYVKGIRAIVQPNHGFEKQLLEFEASLPGLKHMEELPQVELE